MIEVIAGTNRPQSNTRRLACLIERIYRDYGREVDLLDLQDLPAEIFLPSSYAQKPASFAPLAQRVLRAEGLHVVVPEYNGSFPGVVKYFIDMLKFPDSFEHRCVAFTGLAAGAWGAFRCVEQLQMIFAYRNAYILPERIWIPNINDQWSLDKTGLADAALMERLRRQAHLFCAFVDRNAGRAPREAE
jgi:NAD(P)H-dependent FMN reductase